MEDRARSEAVPEGTADTSGIAAVRSSLDRFASTAVARLPLYRHLAGRAAHDEDVAALLLLADPDDRNPTLLLAAVHDRLLAGVDDPLSAWYPSVDPETRPVRADGGSDDPWPHFRRLALEDVAVAEIMATRGTQTNEVGRCATTLPALALVQRDVDVPLGLVEVGASAGFNLRLDRYRYRWTAERPTAKRRAPTDRLPGPDVHPDVRTDLHLGGDHRVLLTSRWRGERPPPVPVEVPEIAHRVGIDRAPVDVSDPASARWLVACQWPEQTERLERCRTVLEEARSDPAEVRRGDLLAEVESLVAEVPDEQHPVVLATWVLAYLDRDGQRAFLAALDRAGTGRDLTLVVQEEPSAVRGLGLPGRPDERAVPGPTALCRIDWRGGRRATAARLADQHPHGTWAEWFN